MVIMNVLPFSSLMKEWILQPRTMKQFVGHLRTVIINVLPSSSLMKEWILQLRIMKLFEKHLRTGITLLLPIYGQISGSEREESIVGFIRQFIRQLRNP
jgi:hypothetical protein